MNTCCPLCQSQVGKLKVMFVKHVTSSKENMEAYFRKELTYAKWLDELKKEIDHE